MNAPFQLRGGARVGSLSAPWPFAQLTATPQELRLHVRFFGDYAFAPNQLAALTEGSSWFSRGVQLHHGRADAPSPLVFCSSRSPHEILAGIRNAGFVPSASSLPSPPSGRPVRLPFAIAAIVLWNALLLGDFFSTGKFVPLPGLLSLAGLGLVLFSTLALLRKPGWGRFVLQPGREVGEIRPHLKLLAVISAFLLAGLSLITALRFTAWP